MGLAHRQAAFGLRVAYEAAPWYTRHMDPNPYRATWWQKLPFKMTTWRNPVFAVALMLCANVGALKLAELADEQATQGILVVACLTGMAVLAFVGAVDSDKEVAAELNKAALGLGSFLTTFVIGTWVFG